VSVEARYKWRLSSQAECLDAYRAFERSDW
jgi:hypothetical protein